MKELSAHIMDIVQNSITAGADLITVDVLADEKNDTMTIKITDNGKGMSREMLEKVTSPFTTTRTTRRVGLGIPLFKAGAENSGGSFEIDSKIGEGTTVCAVYKLSNIDRPPIGDLSGVLDTLVICNENIDFVFKAALNENEFDFSTIEIKETLGGVPISNPDVSLWIQECLKEGIIEIFGGKYE